MSEVKHYWPEEIVGTGELVVYLADYAALEAERDELRQQLAERDAEIMEQCRLNGMGAERELKLLTQRDKLAGLLGECRGMVAREVERWTRSAAIIPVNANVESGLLTRIDASLSAVKGGE